MYHARFRILRVLAAIEFRISRRVSLATGPEGSPLQRSAAPVFHGMVTETHPLGGRRMRQSIGFAGFAIIVAILLPVLVASSQPATRQQDAAFQAPEHAKRAKRLLVRNTMVIYGSGKPPFGPVDVLIEDNLIVRVGPGRSGREALTGAVDAVIDGTGKYVMPGLVNTHMHWHEERQPGIPQPIQYERNLYLAAGTTTTRELGGNFDKSRQWRQASAENRIIAPRMVVYARPAMGRFGTPEEIRTGVRAAKQNGADGLKIGGLDRDQIEALLDEARIQGLPTTAHIGLEETTARDYIELGVTSIEHFYGIADAAIDGIQDFPPDFNHSNELHRFARAGELYAQANPERLRAVVESMVTANVAWSPTLSIYEASRDVIRAQNLPWYREYLHPSLEEFWKPSLLNHGSYFIGWTNTHEVRWRRNFRIWMDALRHFGIKGGLVTTGDDAGYIYSLYGFGLIREMELHEEAGFHPLEVIRHATTNGAKLLGLGDRLGRVRQGYLADLLVVNGNPLENLRLLNPYGTSINVNDRHVHGGGIEWTIKDGIPYHVPTLMDEVREIVAKARAERQGQTTAGGH
jgi:imidazolonepropionase-like amidohydrolase